MTYARDRQTKNPKSFPRWHLDKSQPSCFLNTPKSFICDKNKADETFFGMGQQKKQKMCLLHVWYYADAQSIHLKRMYLLTPTPTQFSSYPNIEAISCTSTFWENGVWKISNHFRELKGLEHVSWLQILLEIAL